MRTNESVESHPPALHSGSERHEEDFMTGEMIAGRLNQTVDWVNSVCRPRCPNPIPFHNVGSRRFFLWSEVHAWVVKASRTVHSPHRPRTKAEVAAVQDAKTKKRGRNYLAFRYAASIFSNAARICLTEARP
jgi:hypothetical protein